MNKLKIYLFSALMGTFGNAVSAHLTRIIMPRAVHAAKRTIPPSIARRIAPSIATLSLWRPTLYRQIHIPPKLNFNFKEFMYGTNTQEKSSMPTQKSPFIITFRQKCSGNKKYIIFAKTDNLPKVAMDVIDKKIVQKYITMFNDNYNKNNIEALKKLINCSCSIGNILVESHNGDTRLICDNALQSLFYDTLSQAILDKKYDLIEFFINENKYRTFEGHKSLTPFGIAIEAEDLTAIKILLSSEDKNHIALSHYIYDTWEKTESGEDFLCRMLDELKLSPEFVNKLYNLIAYYVKPKTVIKMQEYEERLSKEAHNKKKEAQTNKLSYNKNDPFEIFGIKRGRTYSSQEISLIHKELVLKYHPDANANKGIDTTEIMQKINDAYVKLIMMYPV